MNFQKKYKAIMLDVDGTLIINHYDALPSVRVREAFEKAKGLIHIGIATGRPMHQLDNLFTNVSFSGPSIVNGGTQIIHAGSQKILKEQRINHTDIFPILSIAKTFGIRVEIVEEGEDITYYEGYEIKNPYGLFTKALDEQLADRFIERIADIPTISYHKTSSWTRSEERRVGKE